MRTVLQLPVRSAEVLPGALWAGGLLGFALGGFFDGILLHQILQWHHLLSALEDGALANPATQIMVDGLFHAAMYVVATVGLYKLYRARSCLCESPIEMLVIAFALIGFGLWHVIDAVLSHWLLGIHRIRMDVDNPLVWDAAWLAVFGLVPLLGGLLLRGRAIAAESGRVGRTPMISLLAAGCLVGAMLNAYPVSASGNQIAVVLQPGVSAAHFLAAADEAQLRLVWADRRGQAWAFALPAEHRASFSAYHLYRAGALYVSGSLGAAACAAWLTNKMPNA